MNAPAASNKSTNGRKENLIRFLRGTFALSSRVSTPLTAAAALRLFLKPTRHPRPAREKEVLATAIPLVGTPGVAAWQWGRGPVILLVHGWEGRGAQLGAFVEPLVEAGFRVVAFDAPAHGASPGSQATLVDFADAITAVAARVGPTYGVIAHSFGCAGATLAMSRGLAVRAAIFIAPPVRLSDGAQLFADVLGLSPEVRGEMRSLIEQRVGLRWDDLDATNLARGQQAALLVMHDREDREIPWATGAELAGVWPRAQLLSTSGLGHRRILRDPGVVETAVRLFSCLAPDSRSDLDRELDVLLH